MITNKELSEVTLSPTKKDYYQIWNELMELADKISERWSPASTNESDPGIVLLKALTAVADKLNYNIDKNTLEAFMPSATQEDSMRKLTEMMGYDMKHYQSATGKATITYKSSNNSSINDFLEGIYFPKFINLKNEDEDINYVTLEDFVLQAGADSREVAIIEGEVIECETNSDNIITALHLDDLNRYFLPEYAIAENGIFITNIKDSVETDLSVESELWTKTQNLNIQQPGSKVYKFGFDSASQSPYIQFPEDIKTLIEDGLKIRYIRTNGLNGNISANVLSKMEKPAIWATAESQLIKNLSTDNFKITNASAVNNGADPESLTAAYNNYKKTIGTFDTLVTCRDYMNKIYQMTESDTNTTPLVSNIIVSDIRDDINKATPICTFNEHGICYKDASLKDPITIPIKLANGTSATHETTKDKIEHFDLVFYPFKTIYGLNNKLEYKNSFMYNAANMQKIQADLAVNKTIAHNIVLPNNDEIACIKNYLRLKAKITTTKKVTLLEEAEILNNIYRALFTNFNARHIDFGEEIPYETLVATIKNADYRIKEVNLDEPNLSTKFCLANNKEVALSENAYPSALNKEGNYYYNKLALRNVLAGKIAAFEYDTDFISEYNKTAYTGYASSYPQAEAGKETPKIKSITSGFNVNEAFVHRRDPSNKPGEKDGLVLRENEVIQFRVPNFKTTKTYPAYVNYFIHLKNMSGEGAIPATFESLKMFMTTAKWENFVNQEVIKPFIIAEPTITSTKTIKEEYDQEKSAKFKAALTKHVVLFTLQDTTYKVAPVYTAESSDFEAETKLAYYYLPINDDIFVAFNNWIKSQDSNEIIDKDAQGRNIHAKLEGIYRTSGVQEKPFGRLIDAAQKKYLPAYTFGNVATNEAVLTSFYAQVTRAADEAGVGTKDGLGRDANYTGIPKDGEYQLKSNEYLLINYTDSKTDESGTERKAIINKIYAEGDIIRANFNLVDSALYHNNHSYSKRDGFDFGGQQPEGMFTLGTNEQIEIREQVKVELTDGLTYLYWTLNSDDPEADENEFKFDEIYNGSPTPNAYTLKEGEHLYYTGSKKQDLVFYGAGTLIVKRPDTPALYKYSSNGEVSEEDIMTNGLAASIPWHAYTLTKSTGLDIIENQYVSLTEGDVIISIDDSVPSENIGNTWRTISGGAEYRFAEDEVSSTLPTMAIPNLNWSVRSRLDFNMSKTASQPLHRGDSLTLRFTDDSTQTLTPTEAAAWATVQVNSNYTCQAAVDTINFPTSEETPQLKLKISEQQEIVRSDGENIALNNYVNGEAKYTKFDFANLRSTEQEVCAFSLNANIFEKDLFGLMLVYYLPDIDEIPGQGAYIKAGTADTPGLELFNTQTPATSQFYLKPGINILKIAKTVTQLEIYADAAKKSSVIFSSLDLIKDINPKLDYRIFYDVEYTDADHANLEQLLTDIRNLGIAQDFYYNVPVSSSQDIDLNAAVESDKLSNPLAWYDPNNVNRKFVISEIDAEYLTTGITLTKASRV